MTQAPTQYPGLRVEGQRVEGQVPRLIVPHNGGELTFFYLAFGPDNYANVGSGIVELGLKKPTMAETASLVHAALNPPENTYSRQIKGIMRNASLWAFTGTLYIPKEGAFIQDDPEMIYEMPFMDRGSLMDRVVRSGQELYRFIMESVLLQISIEDDPTIRLRMPFMGRDSLEQRLNAKDPGVRFVPFGYPIGEMSSSELARNPYVIALAGEEGAEKLARVAEKYEKRPDLFSFRSVDKNTTTISSLDSSMDLRLFLDAGGYHGYGSGNGRAFGVSK